MCSAVLRKFAYSHVRKTYVKMKKLAAKETGIVSFDATLPADISQDEVYQLFYR